jgi:hypothetical protein
MRRSRKHCPPVINNGRTFDLGQQAARDIGAGDVGIRVAVRVAWTTMANNTAANMVSQEENDHANGR